MHSKESETREYLPERYLTSFTDKYNLYQQRYAEEPREGDKILIQLVRDAALPRLRAGEKVTALDIGCSTGNLLFHLRRAIPELDLVGGDLASAAIDACKADPRLYGIRFEVMDVLALPRHRFDIVVSNATTYFFGYEQYESAVESIGAALRPNGRWLSFEFLHPYEQDIHIVERSRNHPDGLDIYFRPYSIVRGILARHGFEPPEFRPFAIPIDLAKTTTDAESAVGYEDLNSYTVRTGSGERLLFRGTLFQPWCHLSAVKAP